MFLNLDAGELPSETEELWAQADVLNVACGGHAGDADSMANLAAFCARGPTRLGAHPSYPDREGFGRVSMPVPELAEVLVGQLRALAEIARAAGTAVTSVKPHGALYHDAARDEAMASIVVRAIVEALGEGVLVIGPPHGELADAAQRFALPYAREGFADRRLRADGSLVPRSQPDALITDPAEAAAQARRLAREVDTICVHADTAGALAIARAVRAVFPR